IDESKLKEMDGYYQVVNDIPKGEIIGKLEYFSGDQLLAAADLSLDTSVKRLGPWDYFITGLLIVGFLLILVVAALLIRKNLIKRKKRRKRNR
ncbi:MAG: hypothetical protein HGA49_09630, partial [Eubacteriaceae bacterium]|nr:hypothetical protein [Eubacteriaceae bacterium]